MDEFRTKGGTKAAIVGIGSNTFLLFLILQLNNVWKLCINL